MVVGSRSGLEKLPVAVGSVDAFNFKVTEPCFLHEDSMNALLDGGVEDVLSQVVAGDVDLP